jgi:hypothetical protein
LWLLLTCIDQLAHMLPHSRLEQESQQLLKLCLVTSA